MAVLKTDIKNYPMTQTYLVFVLMGFMSLFFMWGESKLYFESKPHYGLMAVFAFLICVCFYFCIHFICCKL